MGTGYLRYTKDIGSDDDFGYLEWVNSTITGIARTTDENRWFVVKIDNSFGQRWLGFSGKALGALGIRSDKLTLPPFIPSRVVSQYRFWRRGTNPGRHPGLHIYQRSGDNLQRRVETLAPRSNIFWYSGASARNARASFMAYVWTPDGYWPWYVGLHRTANWNVATCVAMSVQELDLISEAAE